MPGEEIYKSTYTIFGEKGTGKTTMAFLFTGTKRCYTYDNKSQRIHHYLFNDSPLIKIMNAVAQYNRTPDDMVATSVDAYRAIIKDIEGISGEYDWIVHDGLEKLHEICEMYMRSAYKLGPFAGIANLSVWKYRKVLLSNLHHKSLESAKKGVIYTTFAKIEEIEIEEGQIIEKRMTPRYFDAIEEETDALFRTFISDRKGDTKFKCKVWTSKVPRYKTGAIIDFTLKEKGGEGVEK